MRNMRVLWAVVLVLCSVSMAGVAVAQMPNPAEREAELLRFWLDVRQQAANRGDPDAQFDVGMAFYAGRAAAEDPARAAEWFDRAAAQGHPGAHYYLGYLYSAGLGVPESPSRSLAHFRAAGERGDLRAQLYLGNLYRLGQGVPQDLEEACLWYTLAGDLERVDELRQRLSRTQLATLDARLRGALAPR
jgi:uncharacterized protein